MSHHLFDLTGKIALVTGATHGLGMAIATGLAEAGARIIVNDIFPEKLENAIREYAEKGIDVKGYEASGWKCDIKGRNDVISSTSVNIQNKLVELGKEIGPMGADGKIGPMTMKAIWDVLKTVKK